jgi:hypothetical protein
MVVSDEHDADDGDGMVVDAAVRQYRQRIVCRTDDQSQTSVQIKPYAAIEFAAESMWATADKL